MENVEKTDIIETSPEEKEKRNLYLEYALFLILGFLLGIVIKTEASKRITIGFNDYQVETNREVYDVNKLQQNLIEESKNQAASDQQGAAQNQNNGANQPATEGAETSR